jgi:hypothetical protein
MKKLIAAFEQFAVTKEQIEARIQRKLDSITAAQVIALRKIYNSLKDGMSKSEDWFESVQESEKAKRGRPAKTDAAQAPPVVEHPSGQGIGQVEDKNATTGAVEPHTAELEKLIKELDVPIEMILEDYQVSELWQLSEEKTQEIITKLKG